MNLSCLRLRPDDIERQEVTKKKITVQNSHITDQADAALRCETNIWTRSFLRPCLDCG